MLTTRPFSPHMQRLYGNSLRKDAGVTKTLRNAVRRASLSDGPAGVYKSRKDLIDRISKNVREVQGTVEKVFEETADAVEDFISKCESRLEVAFAVGRSSADLVSPGPCQRLRRSRDTSTTRASCCNSPANVSSSRGSPTTSPRTTRRSTRSICVRRPSRRSSRTPRPRPPRPSATTSASRSTSSGPHRRITPAGTGSACTASAPTRTSS